MRRVSLIALLLVLGFFGTQAQAQDNTTPGPVWRVSLYKVKPGKMNDALMDLRQNFRVVNEEYKKQGLIVDYKVYFNSTTDGTQRLGLCDLDRVQELGSPRHFPPAG